MKAHERLLNLREKADLLQKDVANAINMNRSVYNKIETGTRPIREEEILSLANFFNVSTDFLLGKKEIPDLSHYYNVDDLDEEIQKQIIKLDRREKQEILNSIYEYQNSKSRIESKSKTNDINSMIHNLEIIDDIAIKELVKKTKEMLVGNDYKTVENTELYHLLVDCKLAVENNKLNSAEFYNIKRHIYEELLPLVFFRVMYEKKLTTVNELASYFNLSLDFVISALKYYVMAKGTLINWQNFIIDFSNISLDYNTLEEVKHNQIILTDTTENTL